MNTLLLLVVSTFSLCHFLHFYHYLEPSSVNQTLAFYELFPTTELGKKALSRAADLMRTNEQTLIPLIPYINRLKEVGQEFSEEDIHSIEVMAAHLPNRKLKGYYAKTESEVIVLPPQEIDLGKALILSQMADRADAEKQARIYSALLDLMALQILARLKPEATYADKIEATNHFIFEQLHIKFPPHSVYNENIDLFTFLPSVMDNRLGVCLGVVGLYLAIAQRLDLPLEIITPPGHIYIRCRDNDHIINIETTARGVHVADDNYLSIQNCTLQQRTLKEVIGMTHINQASTYLYKNEFLNAARSYEKGQVYMPTDPLLKELMGYSYLFTEKKKEGERLLKEVGKGMHGLAEDYLSEKINLEGIQAIFMHVEDDHISIIKKQKKLIEILKKYPEFREGWHQLAVTWIQLKHARKAIHALTRCHMLDNQDPVIIYYLAVLYAQRYDFKRSWYFIKQTEKMIAQEGSHASLLKDLRQEVMQVCPEFSIDIDN